jgi:serine/threonine protein kinase
MAGTLAWKAPETFSGKYTADSDVFAFGVTGYEVASRLQPFAEESSTEILDKVSARFKVSAAKKRRGESEEQQREDWSALTSHPRTLPTKHTPTLHTYLLWSLCAGLRTIQSKSAAQTCPCWTRAVLMRW